MTTPDKLMREEFERWDGRNCDLGDSYNVQRAFEAGWQAAIEQQHTQLSDTMRENDRLAKSLHEALRLLQGDTPIERVRVTSSALDEYRNKDSEVPPWCQTEDCCPPPSKIPVVTIHHKPDCGLVQKCDCPRSTN